MLAASFASEETTGIRLWDVESGRVICDIPTSSPTAIDFGVSGQGVLAISATGASESAGTAYSTSSGEVLTSVRGVFGQSHRIAFSPDRRRLAISSTIIETQTNEVKIWDLETQRELMTLRLPEIFPRSLHFSPDGHKLIFLGGRTGVHVWDGTPLPE
jgi:WD40 repeat protein